MHSSYNGCSSLSRGAFCPMAPNDGISSKFVHLGHFGYNITCHKLARKLRVIPECMLTLSGLPELICGCCAAFVTRVHRQLTPCAPSSTALHW
jgi:hypothetical protein